MANLPDYVAAAKPVPRDARVRWFSGIAPTYAGVMVWFLFWMNLPGAGKTPGGVLSAGVGMALLSVVVAAAIIYFLFYLVPGLLGMRTGLPLYIVGTSTYGVRGGLFMPGFLMGVLQFFWLGFNAFFVAEVLCKCFEIGLKDATTVQVPGLWHGIIAAAFALLGAFVGLKGIQYVAKVATFLPLIPVVVLLILLVNTIGGVGKFTPEKILQADKIAVAEKAAPTATEQADDAAPAAAEVLPAAEAPKPMTALWVLIAVVNSIVGFFATAGAAGVDIAMNSRDEKEVHIGGLVGIALATVFSCCLALLVVAGYYGGAESIPAKLVGNLNPVDLMKGGILDKGFANVLMILLAISSFPAACFSALIAANCLKTTLPNVKPSISIGIGGIVAAVMAVTGWAGNAAGIFELIGASFGPVCGAMMADYLLSGRKWAGPRAGFNMAGWISWIVGFILGAPNLFALIPGLGWYKNTIPCPSMVAFIVGFVLYLVLAKAGLESKKLDMPTAAR